jgi:hypothetical protein
MGLMGRSGEVGRCDNCGEAVDAKPGERVVSGELQWWVSLVCKGCGVRQEEDGWGFPPAEIREEMVRRSGLWGVILKPGSSRFAAAVVLRTRLRIPIPEIHERVAVYGGVMWKGTQVEVEWLVSHFREGGVIAEGVRLEEGVMDEGPAIGTLG